MEGRRGPRTARGRAPQAAPTRLLLGLALGAAGRALLGRLEAVPGIGELDLLSAASTFAGVLLGWAGGVGTALGATAVSALERGAVPSWALFCGELVGCWMAFGVFRVLAGRFPVGRTIPNTRSYFVLLAAGLAAAASSAPFMAVAVFGRVSWVAASTWGASMATANMLLVPILLLALPQAWWRFAAPLAGEYRPERSRLADAQIAVAVVIVVVLAVTFYMLGATATPAHQWLALLYVPPIVWACGRGGIRAGLILGSLAGIAFLVQVPAEPGEGLHATLLVRQSGTVIYSLMGGLFGGAREREKRLLRRLQGANTRLRSHLGNLVQALRSALGAKDAYTEGHVQRVRQHALATGERLGMAQEDLSLLEIASLLHDVGKIGVPEAILHKAGPLDAQEAEEMRQHPEIGARMVEELDELRAAGPLIRHHQERFDGETGGKYPGYPDGLRGDEIPLGARIIAVVDAFDAMTSTRTYRQALSQGRARETLIAESGRQFDPEVVDAFLEVLDDKAW